MDTTWTEHLPPMAGYYWFLRPDSLGMTTLIKYYYIPDVGWMIQDMDTGEVGKRDAFIGQFSERLLPPFKRPEKAPPLVSAPKEAQEPASGEQAPPVSKGPRDEASGSPAPPAPAPVTELAVLDGHELLLEGTGDADAICSCGGWRLLRVEAGAGRSAQRNHEIKEAHNVHIKKMILLQPSSPVEEP